MLYASPEEFPEHREQIGFIHNALSALVSASPLAVRKGQFDDPAQFIQARPDQLGHEVRQLSYWYLQLQINRVNKGPSLPARCPGNFGPDTQYPLVVFADLSDDWSLERDEIERLGPQQEYNPAYDLEKTCLMTFGYNVGVVTDGCGASGLGINLGQFQAAEYKSKRDFHQWMGGIRQRSIALHVAEQLVLTLHTIGNDQLRYVAVTQEMNGDREGDEAARIEWLRAEGYSESGLFMIPKGSPVPHQQLWDNSLQGLVLFKDVVGAAEQACLKRDRNFMYAIAERLQINPELIPAASRSINR